MNALPEQSLVEEQGTSDASGALLSPTAFSVPRWPHHVDSNTTTSPADSVLMAASDKECPSHQAANLMLRASAASCEPLGTCSKIQETKFKASTSTRSHEPSLILLQQVSPRKKVADRTMPRKAPPEKE
ncbi:hypothetical protein V5799_006913 [Amblyomma americanum]|uniref:Uncharacterized protein n=1 Tax=Amblyomma americanum TaxID=6943 RepID=A0AAQ4DV17_AMBAM